MTKREKLYNKLIKSYNNHINNNTTINNFINSILKIIKQYLDIELVEKEYENLKISINFLSNFLYVNKVETPDDYEDEYYLNAIFNKVEIGYRAYEILQEYFKTGIELEKFLVRY